MWSSMISIEDLGLGSKALGRREVAKTPVSRGLKASAARRLSPCYGRAGRIEVARRAYLATPLRPPKPGGCICAWQDVVLRLDQPRMSSELAEERPEASGRGDQSLARRSGGDPGDPFSPSSLAPDLESGGGRGKVARRAGSLLRTVALLAAGNAASLLSMTWHAGSRGPARDEERRRLRAQAQVRSLPLQLLKKTQGVQVGLREIALTAPQSRCFARKLA